MPLTWDATKVHDYDNLSENETVTREALVFVTMAIGMNEITTANAREFFARVSFWEKVNGAYRFDGDGSALYFTPEEVLRFVGLRTNSSLLTPAKFYKHVWESHNRFNVPRSI